MLSIECHEKVEDHLLEIAAVVSRSEGKWVLGRAKGRKTYELPAGHREENETILEAAKRELYEETGAIKFDLEEVCAYSIKGKDGLIENETRKYGMLYFAEIYEFGKLPNFEIEEVVLLDQMPSNCTYPLVQPRLVERVLQYLEER